MLFIFFIIGVMVGAFLVDDSIREIESNISGWGAPNYTKIAKKSIFIIGTTIIVITIISSLVVGILIYTNVEAYETLTQVQEITSLTNKPYVYICEYEVDNGVYESLDLRHDLTKVYKEDNCKVPQFFVYTTYEKNVTNELWYKILLFTPNHYRKTINVRYEIHVSKDTTIHQFNDENDHNHR